MASGVLFTYLGLGFLPWFACDCKGDEPIRVTVLVILATDKDTKVDAKLKCIAQEVQQVDPKLTGFKLHNMICKPVTVRGKETFTLIDNQEATVVVEQGADKDNRVMLRVSPPLLGEITYSTACGKFLPIVTRYRTNKNELLILAVRVQPCQGK
jgi:hypothetical protein